MGGVAEAVMKMAFGNGFGFRFEDGLTRGKDSSAMITAPSCWS